MHKKHIQYYRLTVIIYMVANRDAILKCLLVQLFTLPTLFLIVATIAGHPIRIERFTQSDFSH